MLGSEVLEVTIGLVLLFLSLSLICSTVIEILESILKHRATDLERGIRELLDDRNGSTITKTFFEHPLIHSLFAGDYDPAKLKRLRGLLSRRDLPSYIPARNFSAALLDIVARGAVGAGGQLSLAAPTVESLRVGVLALPNLRLQRAVLTALDASRGELAQAKASLEAWYDSTMDRVSGWYKRRTQGLLFVVGLALAGTLNIDAITVARRLSEDQAVRQAAVAQAEQIADPDGTTAEQLAALQTTSLDMLTDRMRKIGFPMGWESVPQRRCQLPPNVPLTGQNCPLGKLDVATMVGGWLVSALAVMLGAPFWFDLLNKLMIIRATVKPREKSSEEGTEAGRPAPPLATPLPGTGLAVGSTATDPVSNGTAPAIPFEPHSWRDGTEEGKL